jgi:hypothetical protein
MRKPPPSRLKDLWADPTWRASAVERASHTGKRAMEAIRDDPERYARFEAARRAGIQRLNEDPVFRARRLEALKITNAKRDQTNCVAAHQSIDVETSMGTVRLRRWQARRFAQLRIAFGDVDALRAVKVRKPPHQGQSPAEAEGHRRRSERYANQRAERAEAVRAVLAELLPAVVSITGTEAGVVLHPPRGRAAAHRLLVYKLWADHGFSTSAIGDALERHPGTVNSAIGQARDIWIGDIGFDANLAAVRAVMPATTANAPPRPVRRAATGRGAQAKQRGCGDPFGAVSQGRALRARCGESQGHDSVTIRPSAIGTTRTRDAA